MANKKNEAAYAEILRQEVTKYNLTIKALIQDIRNCGGPQEALLELNAQAREKMGALRKKLEELERVAREMEREKERMELLKEASELRQQMSSMQASFRKANVSCQLRLEQQDKERLLDTGSDEDLKKSETGTRRRKDRSSLLGTSSAVTADLMAVGRQLEETVNRSSLTVQSLVDSSQTIQSTRDEFHDMTGTVGQARKLLSKYGRRELTDKVVIFLALVFFFACVFYVLKKRLF